MSIVNCESILEHCEQLTKNGETLSVSWDGGGDSGWFQLCLDGQPVGGDNPYEDPIIELVERHLGYGSFAGDFSTEGSVTYNKETGSFEGIDNYFESDSGNHQCAIGLSIPKDLWFDQLSLHIDADSSSQDISASFNIAHGPRIEMHSTLEEELTKKVEQAIREEIDTIEDFSGVFEDFTILRKDFKENGNELLYTLEEFSYSYYKCSSSDISIPLI